MGRKALLTVLVFSASSLISLRSATEQSMYRLALSTPPVFDRAQAQSDTEGHQLTAPAKPGSSDVTWSLAATGDAVSTRRVSVYETYPAFKSLVAVIRAADAGFTNLETSLFRMADFNGYPQAESGGIWFVGPPEAAQDLKWMGFNLFNRANNHATEYGVEGMIETDRLLDSLSLVHAGSGMT